MASCGSCCTVCCSSCVRNPGRAAPCRRPMRRGAAADSAHLPAGAAGPLWVAPELVALTDFLRQEDRLSTPGLFVMTAADSVACCVCVQRADAAGNDIGSGSPSAGDGGCGAVRCAVQRVRRALDAGAGLPEGTTAHDAAATLLAFLAALPQPLMPQAAKQVCDVCLPAVRLRSAPNPGRLARPQCMPPQRAFWNCRIEWRPPLARSRARRRRWWRAP